MATKKTTKKKVMIAKLIEGTEVPIKGRANSTSILEGKHGEITPKDFPVIVKDILERLSVVDNPETISVNFPMLLDVLKSIAGAPFQKQESEFGALSRSIVNMRNENLEMKKQAEELKRDKERLTNSVKELSASVKSYKMDIAKQRDEAETLYQERIAALKEYEDSIEKKNEDAKNTFNAAERMNREAKMILSKAESTKKEIETETKEKENYINVAISQSASLNKKMEELEKKKKYLTEQDEVINENKKSLERKIQELNSQRLLLSSKEAQIAEAALMSKRTIAEYKQKEELIRRALLSANIRDKDLDKKKAEIDAMYRSVTLMANRLEGRYGTKGVVDFLKEKVNILQENENLKAASKAFQIMVKEAKKRGWTDREFDIPVFSEIGDNTYVKKLREQA